jgi:predicted lipoprotein with Yx(FWY)xxD motif
MKTLMTSCLVAAALAVAAPAFAAPPTAPAGATLAGDPARGRALYTYDKDSSGSSACLGPCVSSWPPLAAAAGAKAANDWSVISRSDGTQQWAYKGKPVYGFFRDTPNTPAGGDNKVPGWSLLK